MPGYVVILLSLMLVFPAVGCNFSANRSSSPSVLEITADNFQREVIEADKPVLVEFWAPWCQPCVEMAPAMEQVAQEFTAVARFARIRIDTHRQLADQFEVKAPPAIILFHQGQEVKRRYGKQTESQLSELISDSLKTDVSPKTTSDR